MPPPRAETLEVCREIYAKMGMRCDQLRKRANSATHGFKILGGPPRDRPPLMFIAYQPGGSNADDDLERNLAISARWPEEWPPSAEFASADWKLARTMRRMFSSEMLDQSVSLNAIFLRFQNVTEYRQALDVQPRRDLEAFCLASVRTMIRVMQPTRIIIIGLSTADMFGASQPILYGDRGQRLVTRLTIEGVEATAVAHLTGMHLNGHEMQLIKSYLCDPNPVSISQLETHDAVASFSLPSNRLVASTLKVEDKPNSVSRIGSYGIRDLKALRRRADNRQDPRWKFYDAIINLNRLEEYYAKFTGLKVSPETFQSSPRTAHTEMAWARKRGWIIDVPG